MDTPIDNSNTSTLVPPASDSTPRPRTPSMVKAADIQTNSKDKQAKLVKRIEEFLQMWMSTGVGKSSAKLQQMLDSASVKKEIVNGALDTLLHINVKINDEPETSTDLDADQDDNILTIANNILRDVKLDAGFFARNHLGAHKAVNNLIKPGVKNLEDLSSAVKNYKQMTDLEPTTPLRATSKKFKTPKTTPRTSNRRTHTEGLTVKKSRKHINGASLIHLALHMPIEHVGALTNELNGDGDLLWLAQSKAEANYKLIYSKDFIYKGLNTEEISDYYVFLERRYNKLRTLVQVLDDTQLSGERTDAAPSPIKTRSIEYSAGTGADRKTKLTKEMLIVLIKYRQLDNLYIRINIRALNRYISVRKIVKKSHLKEYNIDKDLKIMLIISSPYLIKTMLTD